VDRGRVLRETGGHPLNVARSLLAESQWADARDNADPVPLARLLAAGAGRGLQRRGRNARRHGADKKKWQCRGARAEEEESSGEAGEESGTMAMTGKISASRISHITWTSRKDRARKEVSISLTLPKVVYGITSKPRVAGASDDSAKGKAVQSG
jgi:hypothetical protein